jgi:hypothetical protein
MARSPRRRPTRPAGSPKRRRRRPASSVPPIAPSAPTAVAALVEAHASDGSLVPVDTPPLTRSVTFSALWLVGLVYYFVTAPPLTPFPLWFGWTVILTTIFALIVLGRRFPMFGLFLLIMITSLMRGGRRPRW